MPDELLLLSLSYLDATALVSLCRVCKRYKRLSVPAAASALHERHALSSPCSLRSLWTLEAIESAVGPRPSSTWVDEWAALDAEQEALMTEHLGPPTAPFEPSVIAERLASPYFRQTIEYQVQLGWSARAHVPQVE